MTAGLAELLAAPTGSGVAAVLHAADAARERVATAEFEASFAPQVRTRAHCPCGSVFEARDSEIKVTDCEKSAAAAAVAKLLGRDPASPLIATVAAAVLDAINTVRADDDYDALSDWNLEHAGCDL